MKLLHAADFHLDSPFPRLSVQQAMTRRRELRQLPARLAEVVREEQADLVLLPGDLFDGERVYPETIQALAGALGDMSVPVFIAPGNHDHCRPGSPYLSAQWPGNVHIFTRTEMESVPLPGLNCVVHGCAFTAPHREDDPLAGFAAPADGQTHLLCVHGEVGTEGRYAPIPPASLASSGAAYAALGHIHACSGLQWAGRTAWAYPGCPEGRGFDECGPRGVLIADIRDGGVSVRFRPVCSRQYRIESVEPDRFAQLLSELPGGDLVRLILTGESAAPPDLAALAARAEERFFYAEVRDETTLPGDVWARSEEDSLTGLFLREMRRRLDSAAEEDRPALLLAARFGLAALEGGEDIRP